MCVAIDGRQTIADRWLSPLVMRIRTGSQGGIKRHEVVNGTKARPTLPFLLLIKASETLGIPALYYLSKEQQGENADQWLKEGQHKYELGGEEQCNISKKKKKNCIK